jgi:hypothetical protein
MAKACRSCGAPLDHVVLDLGQQPLSNSYPDPARLDEDEARYPLAIAVCMTCWLVQLMHDVDRR